MKQKPLKYYILCMSLIPSLSGEMWQLLSFFFPFNFKGNEGGEGHLYVQSYRSAYYITFLKTF